MVKPHSQSTLWAGETMAVKPACEIRPPGLMCGWGSAYRLSINSAIMSGLKITD